MIVGIALLLAAVASVTIVRRNLQRDLEDAARLRAFDFVALLESGTPADELHIRLEEDVILQILDPGDRVVAASPFLQEAPPIADMSIGATRRIGGVPDEADDAFIVVAEGANTPSGPFKVLAGRNVDSVEDTTRVLSTIFILAIPLLLGVVALTTWGMVGKALSPVEKIRSEVAEISAGKLERRVPEPQGDDEIGRLSRTMNQMLARLEASRDVQHRLVSDASHELRNPIATIRHYAESALKHPSSTTIETLAGEVLREDLRLQSIAEDLLLLARADERSLPVSAVPVDLDDLVLEEASRVKSMTTMSVDTSEVTAARAIADPGLIDRLLRNLTSNAMRHAESGIALGSRYEDGQVVLTVDDDGQGIEESSRAAVFERFRRLDDARARGSGGAGLGLSIVAEIAAAHGGTVTAGSAPGGGARFEVRLPGTATAVQGDFRSDSLESGSAFDEPGGTYDT
jgi:signal transduction histidine kinase